MKKTMFFSALTLLTMACGGTDPKPAAAPEATPSAAPATSVNTAPSAAKVDSDPTKGQLNISDAIRKACGLTDSEAFFAYDSANVRPADKAILRKLAECFTKGPLKGREMRLVGHADPRGEEQYNLALGGQRADNVKRILVTEGMTEAKASTSSRGEMDASGQDEAGWTRDRRVDVALGD